MTKITPQPGIMDIALYVGGKAHIDGVSNVVKLSSNENPYGPSPAAKEAVSRSVHELHRYPSTEHAGLRGAIADVHGLDADRIICGVDSDDAEGTLRELYAPFNRNHEKLICMDVRSSELTIIARYSLIVLATCP